MFRGLLRPSLSLGRKLCSKAPKDELAFAWITPKALAKSLEGAIMARLLSTPGVKLVGARMIDPSAEFVDEYVKVHSSVSETMESGFAFHHAMNDFLDSELRESGERGYPPWMQLLLFKGPNAREVAFPNGTRRT